MSWKLGYMFQTVFAQLSPVTDALFISSAHGVHAKRLQAKGITCVINVTTEVPDVQGRGIEVLRIKVMDVPHTNLSVHFERCADKIDSVARAGGRTLVHCVAGVSRSASICLAYLMKYHKLTLREAYDKLKTSRPVIHPNNGFFRQLINYEKKLFSKTSVKMVTTSQGQMPDIYKEEMEAWYKQARQEYMNRTGRRDNMASETSTETSHPTNETNDIKKPRAGAKTENRAGGKTDSKVAAKPKCT